MHRPFALATLFVLLATSSVARAADVLVVSDAFTDTNIATVLQADGHTVTLVSNDFMGGASPTLAGDLSRYDVVFWSATVNGFGGVHTNAAVFTNLVEYVSDGGRVFVTGYDVISFPDAALLSFLGGTGAIDYPGAPGVVASIETSLTVGRVDIRGVIPHQYPSDYDAITGLAPDTMQIAGSGAGGAQWTLRALGSGEIAYVSNGEYSVASPTSWSSTGAGGLGAYNAAIRNFAAASEGSASEPGAPTVRFTAPYAADEGAALEVRVEVADDDGDAVTWSWDLDGDGTFGEQVGAETVMIAAGTTDGEGTARISVEATDGAHATTRTRSIRIRNVAPVVTSTPPSAVSVDQDIRYTLGIVEPAGDLDPLTFTVTRGPGAVADGVYRWMPTETDVTGGGREPVHVTVLIDDGDGGSTMHEWEMTVSPNHAPSTPVALYPVNIAVLETTPRLAVQNSTDLDADDIVYHFEIDTSSSFDSPDLQEGEAVPQTPGYTAWAPEGDLHVGQWYWRAIADDGVARVETLVVSFYVVPDPSMIPDAGPVDGGGAADAGVGPAPGGRSGCAVGGGSSPVALALVSIAIALVVTRRRRR